MPKEKLAKFEELWKLVNESISRKELEFSVGELMKYVKTIKSTTESDLKTITQAVNSAISRIESTASENYAKTSEKLTDEAEKALNDVQFKVEALIAECQAKMDEMHDGEDGEDADEDEIVEKVLALIPEHKEESAEETRDLLETLTGEERLDKSAIKGLDELEKKLTEILKRPVTIGGARGVDTVVNGTSIGFSPTLHLSGSGLSYSQVGNHYVVTITSGSGATAVETPTGAVNGTNDTYTVTHEPLYIIVDGVSKFVTLHYTYVAGTITVTDGAVPTQYIRSVYSA